MRRRFLWISEHASPLATLGGADGGGQNVYVAQVARHLAASGHEVDILTRRDNADLPPVVPLADGARVVHVPAGPAGPGRRGRRTSSATWVNSPSSPSATRAGAAPASTLCMRISSCPRSWPARSNG